jgi:Mg2+/Co2+ transporter CorC
MLMSILRLEETRIRDIMVNRMSIVGLEINTPCGEVLSRVRKSGFSRIPFMKKILKTSEAFYWSKIFYPAGTRKIFSFLPSCVPQSFCLK